MKEPANSGILLKSIGVIRTPYQNKAPYQVAGKAKGAFKIEIYPEYTPGLNKLATFRYIYVIYYLDKINRSVNLTATPPLAGDKQVGVFASRSPFRPNPVGLSVVKLERIKSNTIFISGIDALDMTPLIDIKPYIGLLDVKSDANSGWIDSEQLTEQFKKHILDNHYHSQ